MTVYGSDGRVLTKADGSAYFSAIGQLGGRPRRWRFRRKVGLTGPPPASFPETRRTQEEEELPIKPVTTRFA